jgi:ribosomal-protein-alanine N-acetyltransferase
MKDKDFSVREYQSGDYDEVEAVWESTGLGNKARGDDANTIEESIRIGGKLLLMVQNNTGRICGTSWMTYDGRRIHLHHFGLHPDYQGKGLSKLLLKHSLDFVRTRGRQVKLEVHETNLKAINLYKKAGFKRLGDYDVYIIRDISSL